jgi:hypothetical protein
MISVHLCPGRNAPAAAFLYGLLATHPELEVTRCETCGDSEPSASVFVMVTGRAWDEELAEVARVHREHPQAALIVLSLCDSRRFHEDLLAGGADRFVPLDDAMPGLIDAIIECAGSPRGSATVAG